MKYVKRILDDVIDKRIEAFNAVNIVGPKGCGKTRTAKERCNTVIEFQDEEKRDGYIAVAETSPSLFLKNTKPILFDEWQDAPKIWGTLRKDCDDNPEAVGEYYLTSSTSKKVETSHTGTGRITELELFGHVFENLVIRDLLVYASAHGAKISHYSDDTGLEADAVYQRADGRYALIEIKTGASKIPSAEKSLLKFKKVIKEHNMASLANPEHPRATYREPDALIVICANAPMSYTTENGVKVIPIGCLRD